MTMPKRLRLKGHRLITSWSGVGDNFANGRCECGHWHYDGWTERMRQVRNGHQSHLRRITTGNAIPGRDVADTRNAPTAEEMNASKIAYTLLQKR